MSLSVTLKAYCLSFYHYRSLLPYFGYAFVAEAIEH